MEAGTRGEACGDRIFLKKMLELPPVASALGFARLHPSPLVPVLNSKNSLMSISQPLWIPVCGSEEGCVHACVRVPAVCIQR